MRVPLNVSYVPSTTLRKKARNAESWLKVNYEESSPPITLLLWWNIRDTSRSDNIRCKNDIARSRTYTHLRRLWWLIFRASRHGKLERFTLPTASPTSFFTLISQLERNPFPSSGDSSATASLCSASSRVLRWETSGVEGLREVPRDFEWLASVRLASGSGNPGMASAHEGLRAAKMLSTSSVPCSSIVDCGSEDCRDILETWGSYSKPLGWWIREHNWTRAAQCAAPKFQGDKVGNQNPPCPDSASLSALPVSVNDVLFTYIYQ